MLSIIASSGDMTGITENFDDMEQMDDPEVEALARDSIRRAEITERCATRQPGGSTHAHPPPLKQGKGKEESTLLKSITEK